MNDQRKMRLKTPNVLISVLPLVGAACRCCVVFFRVVASNESVDQLALIPLPVHIAQRSRSQPPRDVLPAVTSPAL